METALAKIETKGTTLEQQALALQIDSVEEYEDAAEFLMRIKTYEKEVHERCDPVCEDTHKAHKTATKQRADFLAPAKRAETAVKKKIVVWSTEQERIRQKEQDRLDAEAKKRAEDEKLAEAQEAEDMGDTDLANEILDEPVTAMAPVVKTARPKVAGVSLSKKVVFEITTPSLLPKMYMMPDVPKIRKQVAATGMDTNIPGVTVRLETGVSARG